MQNNQTLLNAASAIPVDWNAYYQTWLAGPQDPAQWTKAELNLWALNYDEFVTAGGGAAQ